MWKFIILIALIVSGYFIVAKLQANKKNSNNDKKNSNSPSDLIACSNCGTLSVETDMISRNSKLYCSKSCAGL